MGGMPQWLIDLIVVILKWIVDHLAEVGNWAGRVLELGFEPGR